MIRPVILCIVAAACAVGLTACAPSGPSLKRPKAVDRYVLAVQAHERGDDARAIELLEAALRENPDLTMAQALLGDLYRAN
jgi:Tfp pilus assembly protein PilF